MDEENKVFATPRSQTLQQSIQPQSQTGKAEVTRGGRVCHQNYITRPKSNGPGLRGEKPWRTPLRQRVLRAAIVEAAPVRKESDIVGCPSAQPASGSGQVVCVATLFGRARADLVCVAALQGGGWGWGGAGSLALLGPTPPLSLHPSPVAAALASRTTPASRHVGREAPGPEGGQSARRR